MVMRDKERRKLITNAKVQRLGPRLIIRATTNTKEMTNRPPIFTTGRQGWTLHWSIKSISCETSSGNHTLNTPSAQKSVNTFMWPHYYQINLNLGTPFCMPPFFCLIEKKNIFAKKKKKEKSCISAFRCVNANEVDYKGYQLKKLDARITITSCNLLKPPSFLTNIDRNENELQGKGNEKRKGRKEDIPFIWWSGTGSLLAEDTSTMIINDSKKINSLLLRIGAPPVIAASCRL